MKILKKVLNRCGQYLTRIEFLNTKRLGSNVLSGVAHYCPKLRCIFIPEIDVAPWTLEVLAQKCNEIVSFTMGDTTDPCEHELSVFFEKNQQLKHLVLYCNFGVTGKCLRKLNAEKIESIVFENCPSICLKNFNVSSLTIFHSLFNLEARNVSLYHFSSRW